MKFFIIILIVFELIFTACDCRQIVSGKVLDANTKKPIDSVLVKKVGKEIGQFTTQDGDFELTHISGGLFGCPEMDIELTKKGYETKNESIPNSEFKVIYLIKASD